MIPNLWGCAHKHGDRLAERRHSAGAVALGVQGAPAPGDETTELRRLIVVALTAWLVTACAVGPRYHRPDTGPPPQYRPASASEDSLASTYTALAASRDSMAARTPDTVQSEGVARPHPQARLDFQLPNVATTASWFDLFQDTVLKQLVITAIKENRDVRVAAATVQEYQADLNQATANLFPAFTVTGQSGREKENFGKIEIPQANGKSALLTIPPLNYIEALTNGSWQLDFWGRLRNARSEAKEHLLAQQASRQYVLLTLVADVATAYLQLRQADLDLDISKSTLASRQETYRLSQEKFTHGTIAELDLRQFEGDVGDAASSVALYEKAVAQTENQISLLLGHAPEAIPRGRPLNEVLNDVDIPVGVPRELLTRRPDVQEAEAQLRAATAAVGAAIAARLPTFSLNGDWGFENFSGTNYIPQGTFISPSNQIYTVYAGISIPIFDFGLLAGEQHAAEARVVEARNTYEQAVLTAFHDVNNNLAEVRADRQQTVALQTEVQALRIAYRLSRDKYRAGYASYLDVLTAQRSLFTAEQSLVATEFQTVAGVVTLYQSLGGGWPTIGTGAQPAGH
jgi:multidrug efflux system outer membrane protein